MRVLCACSDWDFDSPNSYDYDLLLETVTKLKEGKQVDVPIYDFETHKRYPHNSMRRYVQRMLIICLDPYHDRVERLLILCWVYVFRCCE